MDKLDYDATMLRMLSDENTYQLVEKDPTPSLERKMNALLLELKRSGQLPDGVYVHLRSSAARVPQLYRLPKVHKQDVPLHLIVSFVSLPTLSVVHGLAGLLAPVVEQTSFHVRNSN